MENLIFVIFRPYFIGGVLILFIANIESDRHNRRALCLISSLIRGIVSVAPFEQALYIFLRNQGGRFRDY